MKNNVIRDKFYDFALRIINLYKFLTEKKKEYVLSKQALRSGTSIGANVEEALGAQSKKDFVSKFSIAYKESRETLYWLKLLRDSNYVESKDIASLLQDGEELFKIISKIITTSKNNNC